ncbi:MAG: CHAT domain-containing protein [Anaerolineae bacterium]|nr:MAG: CHAT domain-containing protein [Anaerolineae bacterium]
MRTDLEACMRLCETMHALAEASGNPRHKALALLACANAHAIGAGAFARGLQAYEQAMRLYAELDMPVEQARSVIGKLYALANLGRYEQAISEAEWARRVLREHGEWLTLARLKVNLALLYSRQGDDLTALTLLDLAKEAYSRLGLEGDAYWPRVEHNRAVVLRHLGRFEAALQAAQVALQQHERLGQRIAAARARQNLAMTYFVMGKYNRALEMLWMARQVFADDNRPRHVLLVDLFISDCLLKLGRYDEVIERCGQAAQGFTKIGNRYEAGQALTRMARACIELGRFPRALEALEQARSLLEQEGNRVALADLDLQLAELSLRQGDPARARSLAESCAAAYQAHGLPIPLGNAWRMAAQAALAQGQIVTAQTYLGHLRGIVQAYDWPNLRYPLAWLEAQLAGMQGDMSSALLACERALDDLERARNALMVEYRASFLDGKQALYENAVTLNIFLGYPLKALQVAERAKSRSLLDMLAHRLDLSLKARAPQDEVLVQELLSLQEERNRLWRHQASEEPQENPPDWKATHTLQQRLLDLEKRITDLWHVLLVRNADYARDASLWQAQPVEPQRYLPEKTALVEYFAVHDNLLAFVVTAGCVQILVLDVSLADVQRHLQLLFHNLNAVRQMPVEHAMGLEANARGILHNLYLALFAPCEACLEGITHLQIVPHGMLHYLPFQALWDGKRYLVERFSTSYLPASSLLPYCTETHREEEHSTSPALLALGHSFGGKLPRAVEEAQQIAALWGGEALLEHRATRACLLKSSSSSPIVHLAAHGEFRSDMPLFSGVALDDGWLTALDVFNCRIPAALVTLSACETGRSVIGAGDELYGLQRAFFASGASSLLLSLWSVSDAVTTGLMLAFYRALHNGVGRADALRIAEMQALAHPQTAHPYYWAPFILSGAWGPL